jgi:L-threonylcarbamoyladenylate synthase
MKLLKINSINLQEIISKILQGKIFIYPTDTIYGLGCNAENIESVNKIKQIKQRDANKPLSVIAPSINWIEENLIVDIDLSKYLPGPYTLILKKKNKNFLSHVSSTGSLGIRIPDCDFTKIIQKSGVPFITTSVNLSGEPFITQISNVPESIKNKVNIIIDAGELNGKPSILVINGQEIKR